MKVRPFPEPRRPSHLFEWLVLAVGLALAVAVLCPPPLHRRHSKAARVACWSNTKQIALACLAYAEDYDGRLAATAAPTVAGGPHVPWPGRLWAYLKTPLLLDCPWQPRRVGGLDDGQSDDHAWPLAPDDLPPGPEWHRGPTPDCGYLMNRELSPGGVGVQLHTVDNPFTLFLLGDGVWLEGDGSPVERERVVRAASRHRGVNVAYADGHAEWVKRRGLPKLRYAPGRSAGGGRP